MAELLVEVLTQGQGEDRAEGVAADGGAGGMVAADAEQSRSPVLTSTVAAEFGARLTYRCQEPDAQVLRKFSSDTAIGGKLIHHEYGLPDVGMAGHETGNGAAGMGPPLAARVRPPRSGATVKMLLRWLERPTG